MKTTKPRVLVFASGTIVSGGSGFRNLARAATLGSLKADVVGVVSQHFSGGVRKAAEEFGIPFQHFPAPWNAEAYGMIAAAYGAEWCALSGWTKFVVGLDPRTTFNIHPGPLPRFGGRGLHGNMLHTEVHGAFMRGEIDRSEVCMHFVTDAYDSGPVFFRRPVSILRTDAVATLAMRVNAVEHEWQAHITDLVVNGIIRWDGHDPTSLITPQWCLNPK